MKALLLAAVLALGAGLLVGCGDDGEAEPTGEEFGVSTPQATNTEVQARPEPEVERVAVAGRPDAIAAGAGHVWVTDSFAGTLQRINPRNLRVRDVPVDGFPTDIAAGEGAAWLALPDRGAVQSVSAGGRSELIPVSGFPFEIAAGEGGVWAMSQKTVERIDPGGEAEGSPTRLGGSGASIAAGEGWVWVARANREVVRLSPDDGELSDTVAAIPNAFSVTVGESAAWALGAPRQGGPGTVTRVDPGTGEPAGMPVPAPQALDVAAGLGYLWISSGDGTVTRFDPGSGSPVGPPIRVGPQPQAMAIGEGALWVASAKDRAVYRITP